MRRVPYSLAFLRIKAAGFPVKYDKATVSGIPPISSPAKISKSLAANLLNAWQFRKVGQDCFRNDICRNIHYWSCQIATQIRLSNASN